MTSGAELDNSLIQVSGTQSPAALHGVGVYRQTSGVEGYFIADFTLSVSFQTLSLNPQKHGKQN